jgi:hypothetical protein
MMHGYGATDHIPHGEDGSLGEDGQRYDLSYRNHMGRPPARRGPFKSNDDREKTAQTRKIGSCVRCRMQRIRVSLIAAATLVLTLSAIMCLASRGMQNWADNAL